MSTGANASLLYQPFTSSSRCSLHHSVALLHRRWKPPSKPLRWKKGRESSVICSSAAPGTEPSIEAMLSELEQGTEQQQQQQQLKRRPAQLGRSRTFTVQDSELVAGKVLTGRVKGIMTFGAFIDLGARIDGLLHISKMGEGYIRNVEDVVQVGQEVEVEIMEADIPNRRVKLKMYNPAPAAAPPPAPARGPSSTAAGREAFRGKIAGRGSQQQASRTGAGAAAKAKTTNYQKGQEVNGVVKNLTRRGCFVQLPGDEEGFLHANEISEVGDTARIDTLVKVGQEVKVKVLRFVDGRLILSMKEEVDLQKMNEQFNENLVATNPFELAFRKSAVLRKYLEESGKLDVQVLAKKEEEEADAGETQAADKLGEVEEESASAVEARTAAVEEATTEEGVQGGKDALAKDEEVGETEKAEELGQVEEESRAAVEARTAELEEAGTEEGVQGGKDIVAKETDVGETEEADKIGEVEEESGAAVEAGTAEVTEESDDKPAEEDQAAEPISNGAPSLDAPSQSGISAALVKQLREQSGAGMMDCKKALVETGGDMEKAVEYLRKKGLAGAEKKASRIAAEGAIGSYVHDSRIGVLLEVNCETDFVARGDIFMQLVEDLGMQVAASQQVEYVSIEDVADEVKSREMEIEMQREDLQSKPEAIRGKIVEGRVTKRLGELSLLEQPFIKNDTLLVKDLVKQTIASVGENIQVRRFTRYVLGEGLEKRTHDLAAEVAAQTKVQEEKREAENDEKKEEETAASAPTGVAISAGQVKQLREETGAGMMDCKKALTETQGDLEKAREFLRKKGLASAEKKAGRVAAEGLVVSYVHTGRIGVLLEVNCETDFVARNTVFKELADDLAMQVVACPTVDYVSVDDVPEEVKQKEREIEMQREDLVSKPEQVRGKIVEGRLSKLLAEKALLEQPYLKDDSLLIKDLVSKTAGSLGENIKVRRFVRYTLGEGIQKKSQSFAQEVAAQVKAA